MIAALLNHLWQSTLFALGAGLLTLALRRNSARIRYGLWFAASVKFLIPFALLAWASGQALARLHPATAALPHWEMIRQVVEPLAGSPAAAVQATPATIQTAIAAPPAAVVNPLVILAALWGLGAAAVLTTWTLRWMRVRAAVRAASPMPIPASVPVLSSSCLLEPGVVGIWRPVMVLPEGIAERLSPAEMDAVLAHELCHLRRRDNLTAAIHMLVEALFWFHPLVWWVGARLIAERERACDEAVVGAGADPRTYAEGILKVCRLYLRQPLACAAGVSGANLKTRIATIMANPVSVGLGLPKKLLLAFAAVLTLAAPLAAGLFAWQPAAAQIAGRIDALQKPVTQRQVRQTLQAIQGIETAPPAMAPTSQAPVTQRAAKPRALTLAVTQDLLSAAPEIDAADAQAPRIAVSLTRPAPEGLSAISPVSLTPEPVSPTDVDYPRFGGIAFRGMSIGPEEGLCRSGTIAPPATRPGAPSPAIRATLQRFVDSVVSGKPDYEEMSPAMAKAVRKGLPAGVPDTQRLGHASSARRIGFDRAGNDVYGVDQKGGLTHWNIALNRQGQVEVAFICDGVTQPVRATGSVSRLRFGGIKGGSPPFSFPCPDVRLMDARAKEGRPPPAQVDSLLRRFVQDTMAADKPDYDDMSPAMASAVRKALPDAWPDLVRRFRGATSSRQLGRDDLGNDLYLVHITGRDSYSLIGVNGAGRIDAALFCSAS